MSAAEKRQSLQGVGRRLRGCRRVPSAFGFTLLEVLLSLALFTIATGILAGSLYSGLQAYRSARSDTQIENRYRLVLRQVLAISDRETFDGSGEVRLPDGDTADWETTLEQGELLDLFVARVSVRLRGDITAALPDAELADGRQFELLLYRPDWAEPMERGHLLEDRRTALEKRREER